jgi:hypothetical protein
VGRKGRRQRFCCDAHRKAFSRLNGQNGQSRIIHHKAINGQVSGLQHASDGPTESIDDLNEVSPGLSWAEVNDSTWKLMEDKKALAHVVNIEGKWLARCEDRCWGPTTLGRAKRAANAMHEIGIGRKIATDAIDYLNRVTVGVLNGAAPRLVGEGGTYIWPAAPRGLDDIPCGPTPGALHGDYPLEYYDDGYPKLPACLDRRKPIAVEEAA